MMGLKPHQTDLIIRHHVDKFQYLQKIQNIIKNENTI